MNKYIKYKKIKYCKKYYILYWPKTIFKMFKKNLKTFSLQENCFLKY